MSEKIQTCGIILLEKIKKFYEYEDYVLLFRNKRRKIFEETGGKIDNSEKPWEACMRECKEESNCSIILDEEYMSERDKEGEYIDIEIYGYKHRSYVLYIENYDMESFYENLNELSTKCKNKVYKEMNTVKRFKLNDIQKINENDEILNLERGKKVKINSRTIKSVNAILTKYSKDDIKKIKLEKTTIKNPIKNEKFLKKIKCYCHKNNEIIKSEIKKNEEKDEKDNNPFNMLNIDNEN